MWFRSIIGSPAGRKPSHTKRRRQSPRRAAQRLRLESLESRWLLTFMAPVDYMASPYGTVAAGDFAHNGIQDLAVAADSSVEVLMGNGNGTFKPSQSFSTGSANTGSLAVGDLTGDGKLDIVTANYGSYGYSYYYGIVDIRASVSVLMGNGDGTFQAPLNMTLPNVVPPGHTTSIPQRPVSVALGDMNHDGRLDAVVTTTTYLGYSYVDVLLGHGDGTFSAASTTLLGKNEGQSVVLGDFSGDGKLDVATAMTSSNNVAVLTGNGDGTLGAPTYYATGTNPASLAVGDLNGDGKLDLVTANYGISANRYNANNSGSVSVLLGNGDGTFQSPETIVLPAWDPPGYNGVDHLPLAQSPLAVVVGDLNGDGKMDLAVTAESTYYSSYGGRYSKSDVNILLGNGEGGFAAAQIVPLNDSNSNPASITAADFNGDAFPDLVVANVDGGTVSVLNNGANWSTVSQPSSFSVSGFPSSIQAGTPGSITVTALNADGTIDTGYTGTVILTSSDGQAALPRPYTFTASDAGVHTFSATLKSAGTQSITSSDDLAPDVTGNETGIAVTPAAASHFAISAPANSTAGSALGVTVTALDPSNNTATGYAGTVQFTSSDGQAVLPGDYTFTASDAGVHTFASGVTLKTAGSQTVAVTDTSNSSVTGGASVLVNAAAASNMIVSGFPSPITAGVAGSFTVTLKDAYGNIATLYTGTVHFASSDAKAVLPATYTFTSADAGRHTFTATLKTAGTQSISATDTVNAALDGSDSGITVKAAAASKFVLSAPSSVMPGQAFSLTVTVEDAYGNIVTGYTGTIHFSSSDNKATLPANYTFTASDSGVHTFTGLVKKAGNQTVTVTDTKKSSITGKTVVDVV